jgi:hypothetical protein
MGAKRSTMSCSKVRIMTASIMRDKDLGDVFDRLTAA